MTHDIVTVYPDEGRFPEIARALLDVADHPSQVAYVSHPKAGFRVPEHVFDRFVKTRQSADTQGTQQSGPDKQMPKRRGRPRRNQDPAKTVDSPDASVPSETGEEE